MLAPVRRTRLFVPALLAALIAATPASARAAADPLAVKGGRLIDGHPRGFVVRVRGAHMVRRAPPTLRGSNSASITITRR